MFNSNHTAFSRRTLLTGAGAFIVSAANRTQARAAGIAKVTAVSPANHRIQLFADASAGSEALHRIDAGTALLVTIGPDANGWYKVDATGGAGLTAGWTHGDNLTFTQTARVLWDAGVFFGPTDSTGWVGSVRHGIVLTVAGPPVNGFAFVRFGDLWGYTYDSALEPSDQPATDRYGEWWADVNRSTQRANLMIGSTVVNSFSASMSSETGDGFYSTAPGTYWVYEKVEGLQYTTYAKAYFTHWCGFDTYRFNGFHSWTMDQNGWLLPGGSGNTAGCVATEPRNASVIYNFLTIGARVEIHW